MYICLLPPNQLLCQQVAIITMPEHHIAKLIPSVIRIERGLGWDDFQDQNAPI